MSVPTRGETYAKLIEYVRKAQEEAAMMAHLHNTEGKAKDKQLARAWLRVEELFKIMIKNITELAQGRLQ